MPTSDADTLPIAGSIAAALAIAGSQKRPFCRCAVVRGLWLGVITDDIIVGDAHGCDRRARPIMAVLIIVSPELDSSAQGSTG